MMANRKHLVFSSFVVFILLGGLLYYSMVQANLVDYDPWADMNDDGTINILDIAYVSTRFHTSGDPIDKTALLLELQIARTHSQAYSGTLETISGYPAIFDWADLPGMEAEITLPADATLLVMFSAQVLVTGTGQAMYVRVVVDSTPANPPAGVTLTKSSEWASYSFVFYSSSVSAGTHVIKVQWKLHDELGSGQVLYRTLTVIALPE